MYKKSCLFLRLGAALLAHAEAPVRFLRDTTREIDLWQVFFANISDAEQTVTLANGGAPVVPSRCRRTRWRFCCPNNNQKGKNNEKSVNVHNHVNTCDLATDGNAFILRLYLRFVQSHGRTGNDGNRCRRKPDVLRALSEHNERDGA